MCRNSRKSVFVITMPCVWSTNKEFWILNLKKKNHKRTKIKAGRMAGWRTSWNIWHLRVLLIAALKNAYEKCRSIIWYFITWMNGCNCLHRHWCSKVIYCPETFCYKQYNDIKVSRWNCVQIQLKEGSWLIIGIDCITLLVIPIAVTLTVPKIESI